MVCGNYSSTFDIASEEEKIGGSQYDGGHPAVSGSVVSIAGVPASAASLASDGDSGSTSSGSGSGISAAAGGGIGAGVTIVFIRLVATVAAFAGSITFGRKKSLVQDDLSTSSSVPAMKQTRA